MSPISKPLNLATLLLVLASGVSILPISLPGIVQPVQAQTETDRKTEADRLLEQGNQQFNHSQYQEAIRSYEGALGIYQQLKDRQGESNSLMNLGIAYDSLGQYAKAIDFYQQSLVIFKDIGAAEGTRSARQGESSALMNLGNTYNNLGQYAKAIDFFQQSLELLKTQELRDYTRDTRAGGVISGKLLGSLFTKNSLSLTYGYGLVYTNLTEEGMSGGPVLDMRGRVIGIHGRADVEKITDKAGRIRQIPLGWSLGVPISAFVNRLKEVGLEGELRVETFPPPPLTEEESKAILQALFNPKEPDANADAIDWLNYGWQIWRSSGEESESKSKKEIAAFDRAIQLDPNLYQAWYLRAAYSQFGSDKSQDILESLDKVIQINPDFYQAWRWRGFTLVNLERYQEVLESFDRVLQLDPQDLNAQIFRGFMLIDLERYPEALEVANQVLEKNPIPWAYFLRGAAYAGQRQLDKALEDVNEAIRLQPEFIEADVYSLRGVIFAQEEKWEEALADLNEAIRLEPDNYKLYFLRGAIFFEQEKWEEALADLNEAVRLKHDNNIEPSVYYIRGLR